MDAELPRGQTVFPAIAEVHFDGACQPPKGGGIATYGFTVLGAGLAHEESGLAVTPRSPHATNNVAEYVAAIRALEHLRREGYRGAVDLLGDSQLVIRQMNGEYEVRAEHLHAYHAALQLLARDFASVRFRWIPREENQRADQLSKEALGRYRAGERPTPADD
ncbi:MAG: ribonuclease HI family protein [Thermoplasmata archaeon]|nr:ribonuclease HI family protein [Thermoplasmata archaeon]